jgi:phosphoribosyl 1,2-cyclic phosphate phosphodiesterase
MRASLYIRGDAGERIVIDTGPEFRLQSVRAGIDRLDAALLTHAHADHLHGLDDLRTLSWEKAVPVYGNRKTIEELRERFAYIFRETQQGGGKPRIDPIPLFRPLRIGNLTCTPVPVKHGDLDILGWKISEEQTGKTLVYLTDTSGIPEASKKLIYRPGLLIIGGLRMRPHTTHFTFEQALNAGVEIDARRIYLTHICHDHSHRKIEEYCNRFRKERGYEALIMSPAYDGLELS